MGEKVHRPLLPFLQEGRLEAGCDEAGRGCLAGPVVAAAVILPAGFENPLLNDSKQLTENQRNQLRPLIESEALAWAVAVVPNEEVDEVNVLNASFLAMSRAVGKLQIVPEHLLIDGNRFRNHTGIPYTCVVKGDGKMLSIAAASVLAKTWRDALMLSLHRQFPHYGWDRNKGYPTREHRDAIRRHGITVFHRKTFRLTDEQLRLWEE
ncbi:MAG TPA: ribonuclease HII [Prolixibacteraceae bacterium]|nr:ribonuclease HII [Prolixibacteraceae bacterium]